MKKELDQEELDRADKEQDDQDEVEQRVSRAWKFGFKDGYLRALSDLDMYVRKMRLFADEQLSGSWIIKDDTERSHAPKLHCKAKA